jgi:hypothetical protein
MRLSGLPLGLGFVPLVFLPVPVFELAEGKGAAGKVGVAAVPLVAVKREGGPGVHVILHVPAGVTRSYLNWYTSDRATSTFRQSLKPYSMLRAEEAVLPVPQSFSQWPQWV